MADVIRLRHQVTGVTVTVAPESVEGLKTYGFTDFLPVEPVVTEPAEPEPEPVAEPEGEPTQVEPVVTEPAAATPAARPKTRRPRRTS